MTVSTSMSAVWVKLTALLCLCSTVQSGPEVKSEVLWRDVGGFFTIQCRCPQCQSPDVLYVKRALNKSVDVFFKGIEKQIINQGFKDRLQVVGTFPSLDILIKNLSSDDTGPYWCMYSDTKSDAASDGGSGSVLLVVNGEASGETHSDTSKKCEASTEKLVLVSVVISAAVLLCIIMGILLWCIKKLDRTAPKPRRVPNNDVYEDMRGTLRR